MAGLKELFGDKLLGKDGEVDTATALAGKTVGIYFSAHWCPPCRGFTPKLAEFYKKDLKAKGLEVVFVSSDRDEKSFKEYYDEQPWLALPYSNRDGKNALSKKFKVQGIPSFVIVDSEGKTIQGDGRSAVMKDPTGKEFPWKPKPVMDVIGDKFEQGGKTVGKEALAGKTIGIYFSAHWCPPCRGFTPELAKRYKKYKEKGLPFEVIFSTGDRDEKTFNEYREEMAKEGGDWLSIPWSDSDRREELDAVFEVQGIPCLVILDEKGKIINKNGRGAIMSDEDGSDFPWAPPAVVDMSRPEGIEENTSICVFVESLSPPQQDEAKKVLEEISKKYIAEAGDDDPKYAFFLAKNGDGPVPRVRELLNLGTAPDNAGAQIALLDIPDNGGYYSCDAVDVTKEVIEKLLKDYEDKKIERKQLQ